MAINTKNAVISFSNVTASTAVATLVAENGRRVGLMIHNASGQDLYVRLGNTDATTTNYSIKILNGGFYEMPVEYFTCKVTGILSTGSGSVMVTEISDN